jgi:thioredoxin 1
MNVMYFSTQWCGPCKMFKPVVQEVSQELGIPVQYIDAQQNPDAAQKYSISSVPTIVITDDSDNVQFKNTGVLSKISLKAALARF